MEEAWDDTGTYVQAKLADRLVPLPRDAEPPVGLYALCRAWVRNNPKLPLTAETSAPFQREVIEAAARVAGPSTVTCRGGEGQQGVALSTQRARQLEQEARDEHGQQPVPQQEQQQEQRTRDVQEPVLRAPQQQQQDALPNGLISILPPVLPPTALEADTSPPTYPFDDFDAQEPEEAMRKLKEHWVGVRQYHQAIFRAKRARHRERLRVLLGEPSSLQLMPQPPLEPGITVVPHPQQQPQPLTLEGVVAPLQQPNLLATGGPPLGFQGPILLPGLAPDTAAQSIDLCHTGLAPGSASAGRISAAGGISPDAHAALALLSSLSQGLPTAVGLLAPQQPPMLLPLLQQQQPIGGSNEDASAARPPESLRLQGPGPELLAGGLPVDTMVGMPQLPVLGQLSAAVAAAAAVSQPGQASDSSGIEGSGAGARADSSGIEGSGAGARAGMPETNALSVTADEGGEQGTALLCNDSMDVDTEMPSNT